VDDIRNAWQSHDADLAFYPAGTAGPSEADDLIRRFGFEWREI